MVSAARSAIRMRSKESDKKKALASLKHDLQNGPRHCFGFHEHCSLDFCKTAQARLQISSAAQPEATSSTSSSSPPSSSTSLPSSSTPPPLSSQDSNRDDLEGRFRPIEIKKKSHHSYIFTITTITIISYRYCY